MNIPTRHKIIWTLFGIMTFAAISRAVDPPAAPKISTFAPADDLERQVAYFSDRLAAALADKAEFDEAKQGRIKKDASTLAVVILALGMHDGDNKIKGNASAAIKACQELAKNFENFDRAKASFDGLQKALASGAGGASTQWEKVADLATLMKAVPLVNNSLKKAASDITKAKAAETAAGASATLAAIAQSTLSDTSAVKNAVDTAKWHQFSAEMRDAAGEVNKLARLKNQEAIPAAMQRLAKTCEDCHAVFRNEEK